MCKSALSPPHSRRTITGELLVVRELSATTAAMGAACGRSKLAGSDSDEVEGADDVGGGACSASAGELLVVLAKLEGACEFSGPRGRLAVIRDTDQSNSMIRYDKQKYYYPIRIKHHNNNNNSNPA